RAGVRFVTRGSNRYPASRCLEASPLQGGESRRLDSGLEFQAASGQIPVQVSYKMVPQSVPGFAGAVEFAQTFQPRPEISHVLFDFDGTLSLIREGWPVIMLGMFTEMLPARSDDDPARVGQMLFDDMMKLNGKQTIYQMMQFAERVKERGGKAEEPLWYKHEYLRRLEAKIEDRIARLKARECSPDAYLLHGSRRLLDLL